MAPLRPTFPLAGLLALALTAPACGGVGDATDPGGRGGGGADGGADDDPAAEAPGCDQVESVEATPGQPADMLLVVDKSGSMDDPLEDDQPKWPIMRDALITVVNQYDDAMQFGLMLFPQGDACEAGTVRADIAPQNAATISGALNSTFPEGGTPTHTTMTAARAYFQQHGSTAPRYALLATDGEPNCGPLDSDQPTVEESIAAIEALRGDGVATFVLGFGGSVNNYPATLQAMAEAGGTGTYFAANSPAELATALDAIAGEVGLPSCSFRLDETPPDESSIAAYQDQDAVPRDPSHQDGWDYDPATNTVTFYGAACDRIRAGEVSVVSFDWGGCDGGVVD